MLRRALAPLAALALLAASPALAAPEESPPVAVGADAPRFALRVGNAGLAGMDSFALRDLVGPDARAPRTVVLAFAASYCEPCLRELPALAAAHPRLAAAGVVLAVVVVDTEPEGIARMRALTGTELALPFPVLYDRFGLVGRRYGASRLPLTVVVAPDGRVRRVNAGFAEGALEALLSELAPR